MGIYWQETNFPFLVLENVFDRYVGIVIGVPKRLIKGYLILVSVTQGDFMVKFTDI